jgi:hypothetical protein
MFSVPFISPVVPDAPQVDSVKVEGINVHRLFDGCTVFFGSKVPMNTGKEDYRSLPSA